MLVRHYERAGFDVLAITDHWVRTAEPSSGRLLVIPSAELDAPVDERARAHVLALGIGAEPERASSAFADLRETAAWVTEQGGVPYLAHTYCSGLRADDFERCEGFVGLEILNAGSELDVGRGLASLHWDEVLETRRLLCGFVSDDSQLCR